MKIKDCEVGEGSEVAKEATHSQSFLINFKSLRKWKVVKWVEMGTSASLAETLKLATQSSPRSPNYQNWHS
jgi:hypothetical protein